MDPEVPESRGKAIAERILAKARTERRRRRRSYKPDERSRNQIVLPKRPPSIRGDI